MLTYFQKIALLQLNLSLKSLCGIMILSLIVDSVIKEHGIIQLSTFLCFVSFLPLFSNGCTPQELLTELPCGGSDSNVY